MTPKLNIHTVVSMPFAENTYIAWLEGRDDAVVIDPGLEPELILVFLQEQQLTIHTILDTHGHADHIGGNEAMKAAFPSAPLLIGSGDAFMLTDAEANLSAPFGMPVTSPEADRLLQEGDVVEAAGTRFEVLEIPGHSPGHIIYLYRDQPIIVFGGDVLFRDGIGRFDFPGGSGKQLVDGIRGKLFGLPDETVVYPGHGPVTTVGREKRHNPFVGESARMDI
jgi:glyoxylase-like metal-dependent hydrolase (beta-lactamase superfamily II)